MRSSSTVNGFSRKPFPDLEKWRVHADTVILPISEIHTAGLAGKYVADPLE